jgi:hypothetical protein
MDDLSRNRRMQSLNQTNTETDRAYDAAAKGTKTFICATFGAF